MKTFTIKISLIILFSIYSPNIHTFAQTLFWQPISEDIYVVDILYDGNQNLYFSGGSSQNYYFYRPTDLGNTWTQHSNGLNGNSINLAIDSSGTLWGGGRNSGKIYKSTNQGDEWITVNPSSGIIAALEVSPNNWIWAGTLDGKLLYSSDGGNNWDTEDFADDGVWSIGSNATNDIFVGVGRGKIYRTTNLGGSWYLVYEAPIQATIREIVVDDSGYVYATKYKDRLISTDNGNNWNTIPGPELDNIYLDNQHVFYGGSVVGGYRSYDNCLTWSFIGPINSSNAFAVIDSLVFVGTDHGVFLYDPSHQPYIGQNYFPLTVGNKWQYFYKHSDGPKYVYIDSVAADTIINNMKYFNVQGLKNDWVRYSETDKKLYIRYNDSDYIYMDYNLNAGTNYSHLNFYNHEIREIEVIEPGYIMFDDTYHYKGFFYTTGSLYFYSEIVKHAEGLGEVQFDDWWHGPVGTSGSEERKLIRAIIIDEDSTRYLSDQKKPAVAINPILVTNEFDIDLIFKVNHAYSFYYQGDLHDFTDSVLFYSYYANDDTILSSDTTLILAEPNTVDYIVPLILDSTLMKNDYKFYYKIYAVDKGIVPEHSTSPDTGYYELIYDPNPVSIDENNNIILKYSLYQNYPNPFNPVTEIEYSIKDEGNVELIIFDVLGRKVKTLVNQRQSNGNYKIPFDASVLSSGIYLYQLRVNDFIETKKMVLLR